MSYRVDLGSLPTGHSGPPLLQAFADWLATQEHGSIGWFDALAIEEIPASWDEKNAERLKKAGFAFLALPDGSLLALLDTGVKGAPHAVVLLGSEGEARTVAGSLEELLVLLSKGETGIHDLDDEEASSGRDAMKAWLKKTKVKAPKARDFDFQAWLDGTESAAAAAPADPERPAPEIFATWERDMDPGRTYLKVDLEDEGISASLRTRTTAELSSRHGVPKKPIVGLFVAWAIARGLLDESRFPQHRDLIDRVRSRAAQGSALVEAALAARPVARPSRAERAAASRRAQDVLQDRRPLPRRGSHRRLR